MDQSIIDDIITRAQELVAKNDKSGLKEMLACFDKLYYQPELSGGIPDSIYDQVVEIYDKKFGKKKTYHELKGVGAKGGKSLNVRKDVKLPYRMGTMLKFSAMMVDAKKGLSAWRTRPINYEKKFEAWKRKYPNGPYTIEGKADGISCLLIYEAEWKRPDAPVAPGVPGRGYMHIKRRIYSRGTGTTGKDLSRYLDQDKGFNLIPSGNDEFMREILSGRPYGGVKIVIRGELVMRYRTWKKKYSQDFSNPRNIVGGFVTKKTDEGVNPHDIDFVAYELLVPRKHTRFDQIKELKKMGFVTVETSQITKAKDLTEPRLFSELKKFRKRSPYDIDGLVVFDDSKVRPVSKTDVLDSAFAYKVNAQTAIVDVIGIEWSSSTTNALKPVVVYKPVTIGREMEDGSIVGALYRRATAFNAGFVKKNKIGPGSKLLIVRSGDVIPHIEQVLSKSTAPDLPNSARAARPTYEYKGHPKIDFVWGDGKNWRSTLDIFATTMLDSSKIQQMDLFFSGGRQTRGMNVKGIAKKTLKKLFEAGINTITAVLQASEEDLQDAGLGAKTAKNIRDAIDARFSKPVDLAQVMGASQVFPHVRGRTAKKILAKYPQVLTKPPKKLTNVVGVGQDTLDGFLAALPTFQQFLIDNPQIQVQICQPQAKVEGSLSGKSFVFTGTMASGTRAKVQELVRSLGGVIPSSLNKKVSFLVIGDEGGGGGKRAKAEKMGVEIISETEFLKMTKGKKAKPKGKVCVKPKKPKKVSKKKSRKRKDPKKDPSAPEYYLPGGDGWDPAAPAYRR